MANFNSVPFLQIGEETISLGNAMRYLQLSGKLLPLLQELVGLHQVFKEVENRDQTLVVDMTTLEQNIIDFRIQQGLNDPAQFQAWLQSQGIDFQTLQQRVLLGLKIDRLKAQIADPELHNRFEQQKEGLDQIELSCIIAAEEAVIHQFYEQITSGATTFDDLTLKLAANRDPGMGFTRGTNQRRQLPPALRQAIATAPLGELIGPINAGGRWYICRVEQTIPAMLDEPLQRELREQIFNQWLGEKIQTLTVTVMNREDNVIPIGE